LYRQDGIEKARIILLVCQLSLSLIGVITSCALTIGIKQFFDYDWYDDLYIITSSRSNHPLITGWGIDLNDILLDELSEKIAVVDETATFARLYRNWGGYHAYGPNGEFRSNRLAQMDASLVAEIGLMNLQLDSYLLENAPARVLVSRYFAQTLFGHEDVLGAQIQLRSSEDDHTYETFTICGTFDDHQGSQRYLDINSEILLLDPLSNHDFREVGNLIIKTKAKAESVLAITMEYVRGINRFVEDLNIQPYKVFLQSEVELFNVFSGAITLWFLSGIAIILTVIGMVLVLSGKIAEGHFQIGLHYVLGIAPRTVRRTIILWLLPLLLLALVIALVIALILFPTTATGVISMTRELMGMQYSMSWLITAAFIIGAGMLLIVYLVTSYATWKITRIEPIVAVQKRI